MEANHRKDSLVAGDKEVEAAFVALHRTCKRRSRWLCRRANQQFGNENAFKEDAFAVLQSNFVDRITLHTRTEK